MPSPRFYSVRNPWHFLRIQSVMARRSPFRSLRLPLALSHPSPCTWIPLPLLEKLLSVSTRIRQIGLLFCSRRAVYPRFNSAYGTRSHFLPSALLPEPVIGSLYSARGTLSTSGTRRLGVVPVSPAPSKTSRPCPLLGVLAPPGVLVNSQPLVLRAPLLRPPSFPWRPRVSVSPQFKVAQILPPIPFRSRILVAGRLLTQRSWIPRG